MAWETGTAADHIDLFNKIRDFLTTNTELVNAGENWTQMLGPTGVLVQDDIVTLRGPGLTGDDSIYCGMDTTTDVTTDVFNLRLWGHAGYSDTLGQREQPLMSPSHYHFLWDQTIDYWIMATGRRWMLLTKISTVYTQSYVGFFLPYATPSEYPYPMVVAATSGENRRWSSENERDRFFVSPGYNTMSCFYPDNVWRMVANQDSSGSDRNLGEHGDGYTFPYVGSNNHWGGPTSDNAMYDTAKCFDGSFILRDVIICSKNPYTTYMGVLDGVYYTPGRSQSSENIITKEGVDYIVSQNIFRNGFRDYMTMRLT